MQCKSDLIALLNDALEESHARDMDWEALMPVAEYSKLPPLLFHTIRGPRKITVPDKIYNRLKDAYRINSVRNSFLIDDFDKVRSSFDDKGVETILLKGIYFIKTLYRNAPGVRQMADIDILVKEVDVEKADEALASLGYDRIEQKETSTDQTRRRVFMYFNRLKNPHMSAPIHLHWHIINVAEPFLNANWSGVDMGEIWERSSPMEGGGPLDRTMCPEHMILALACHGLNHSFSRLDILYDIHSYASHYSNAISWDMLADTAIRWRLVVPVRTGLMLAKKTFNTAVPPGFFKTLNPAGISFWEKYMTKYIAEHDFPSEGMYVLLYLAMNRGLQNKIRFVATGLRSWALRMAN